MTTAARKTYARTPVRCAVCGQMRVFAASWPVGHVCRNCYCRGRASPRPCASCTTVRVLVGHPEAPRDDHVLVPTLCGPCSGSDRYSYACLRCGGSEERYKAMLCVRCALGDQLREAFGEAPPGSPIETLTAALHGSRRPRSVMKWLTNPRGGARVLRELLDRGITISHDALDTFDEREVWSLRRTLVDLEVLPPRHDPVARLDVITEKSTADLPLHTRAIVRAYASWWYLRRARRRYEQTGKFTYSQFRNAWTRILAVSGFLQWLDTRGVPLEALDQPTLDTWLERVTHDQRTATGDFLRWATRRRLASELTVTFPERTEPTILLSEEQRWAELRRCLTDTTIPDDVRAAGALLLLYGIPLLRIIELTRDHLVTDGDAAIVTGFRMSIGAPTITVPPRLGRLLTQLPAPVPLGAAPLIEARANGPVWLFPGRSSAGHVSSTGLSHRLRTHGLSVRQSRNAALIGLASDLPAPVICDLFGLSVAASVLWTRRAARDWTGYIQLVDQRIRERSVTIRRPDRG